MDLHSFSFQMERDLQFEIRNELTVGKVWVGDLQWIPEKKKWACHWSISHIHPDVGRGYGKDPLEALVRTIDFVSSLIRGSEADGLQIWWQQRGDHAGITFPMSEDRSWEKMPPQL